MIDEPTDVELHGLLPCGLTFDMRGGRQLAKPDVARPLDGRVRPRGLRRMLGIQHDTPPKAPVVQGAVASTARPQYGALPSAMPHRERQGHDTALLPTRRNRTIPPRSPPLYALLRRVEQSTRRTCVVHARGALRSRSHCSATVI